MSGTAQGPDVLTQDGENPTGRAGFRAHLAGRIAHVTMVNAARGAKLKATFDRAQWGPQR